MLYQSHVDNVRGVGGKKSVIDLKVRYLSRYARSYPDADCRGGIALSYQQPDSDGRKDQEYTEHCSRYLRGLVPSIGFWRLAQST